MAMGIADEVSRLAGGSTPNAPSAELAAIKQFLSRLEERLTAVEAGEDPGNGAVQNELAYATVESDID